VNDQRRIARALEVIELTGRPFSAQLPDYQELEPTIHLGLSMDRSRSFTSASPLASK
jgi:tRNA dimethylallyltransferase